MTILTFVPAPGYDATEAGVVKVDDYTSFDIQAALTAGGGSINVDDAAEPKLAWALRGMVGLIISGTAPGPNVVTDSLGEVRAHTLREDDTEGQPGDVLTLENDGTYRPTIFTGPYENPTHKDQPSGYAGLDIGGYLSIDEVPIEFPANVHSVDMCRRPWSLAAGADITTDAQAVIDNAVATSAKAVDMYFSSGGVYNVNGAVNANTVSGQPYAGQILIPGVVQGFGFSAVIRGPVKPVWPNTTNQAFVLQSNASGGALLAVQASGSGAYPQLSDVLLRLEDLTIQNTNLAGSGIDGWAAGCLQLDHVFIMNSAGIAGGGLTSTGTALTMPHSTQHGNMVLNTIGIGGYGVAVQLAEWVVMEGWNGITSCKTALLFAGSGAPNYIKHLWVTNTQTLFSTAPNPQGNTPGGVIDAKVFWEAGGITSARLFYVPTSSLYGRLELMTSNAYGDPSFGLPATAGTTTIGIPIDISPLAGRKAGSRNTHPSDTFARGTNFGTITSVAASDYPGMCSNSLHLWRVANAGVFTIDGTPKLMATTQPALGLLPVREGRRGGESRAISATIALGSPYSGPKIIGHRVNGATRNGNMIYATFTVSNNTVRLFVSAPTATQVATTPASAITAGSTYTLTLVIIVAADGTPSRARVLLNGNQVMDYPLTAAQRAVLGPGDRYPYLEDGLEFDDLTSGCTSYIVRSVTSDDVVTRNPIAAITQAGTTPIVLDPTTGVLQQVSVTDNNNFTLSTPTNSPGATLGQELIVEIGNNITPTAAMGTVTWNNTAFLWGGLAPPPSPANGKKRAAHFYWNGSAYIARFVSPADY